MIEGKPVHFSRQIFVIDGEMQAFHVLLSASMSDDRVRNERMQAGRPFNRSFRKITENVLNTLELQLISSAGSAS